MRPARARIDLAALDHNLQCIRQAAPNKRILAVLKANAYGHGLTRIAQHLSDIDAIGVARVDEALELRKAGVTRPIVLLEGFFEPQQLPLMAAGNLQPVLHHAWQLQAFEQVEELPASLKVWLKVDTGMRRLGIEPEEAGVWFEKLKNHPCVVGEPIVMSHFACADEPDHGKNQAQLNAYRALVDNLQPQATSLANSAALFAGLGHDYDWVRPGLALYGISPFARESKHAEFTACLQPVMSLEADIIATKQIRQGETVGYGAAWSAPRDTRIGIVSIGYGDGYPRHAPEGTPVWVNGKCYPLVGRVAMDMVTIDCGQNDIKPGDTAELWGANLSVSEVAEHVGTIPYELLCNVARRVWLEYSDDKGLTSSR